MVFRSTFNEGNVSVTFTYHLDNYFSLIDHAPKYKSRAVDQLISSPEPMAQR